MKFLPIRAFLILLLVILIICLAPELIYAQGPILPPPPDAGPDVPIDGGLSILAALGGGYAIKKLRDKNKE